MRAARRWNVSPRLHSQHDDIIKRMREREHAGELGIYCGECALGIRKTLSNAYINGCAGPMCTGHYMYRQCCPSAPVMRARAQQRCKLHSPQVARAGSRVNMAKQFIISNVILCLCVSVCVWSISGVPSHPAFLAECTLYNNAEYNRSNSTQWRNSAAFACIDL